MAIVRLRNQDGRPGLRIHGLDLHHLSWLCAHKSRADQALPHNVAQNVLHFLRVRSQRHSECQSPVAATARSTYAISRNRQLVRFGAAVDGSVPLNLVRPVSCIAAGLAHTCVLMESGELCCYGNNSTGQCSVPANLGQVVAVTAGFYHTCAVKACGELVCFGSPGSCNVPPGLGPVAAVAAGQHHTCAVAGNGQLVCFGGNQRGQCDPPPNLGPVIAVAAGLSYTCAVKADGELEFGTQSSTPFSI